MSQTLVDIETLAQIVSERSASHRSITAIAGPPGAGKSTLADALAERLNTETPGLAAVFPMDGYHYDDAVLNARGWRPRKGAPHTFDVDGFGATLARLRENAVDEIAVPVFDRALEISRNAARLIPRSVRALIVEGNYLLLNQPPWTGLTTYFETTVFIDLPEAVITERLRDRWRDLGPEELRLKLEENDLPNARLVISESRPADFVIRAD